jgi:hypothetical protein
MIVEILVEFGRDSMFDSLIDGVGREACAQTLPEASGAATILGGSLTDLAQRGACCYASDCGFADGLMLPASSIRMSLPIHRSRLGPRRNHQHNQRN